MAVTGIVVGFGQRGSTYASYSLDHPEEMKIVGVCEPRTFKREKAATLYSIPPEMVFSDWKDIIPLGKVADFVIIATQDQQHAEPAIAFAALGYHILLEKPMAVTEEDCRAIADACDKHNVMLVVCHVLRYTPASRRIKEIIESGAIGDVINIQHTEPIGFYHFAHSFVRGNWHSEAHSTFTLLSKSCHDVDLIRYWMGKEPKRVSSFGSLTHFKKENKPEGAAKRCLDCPVESKCPYSAKKIYLDLIEKGHTRWPVSVIVDAEPDIENVSEALRVGPYGVCVYQSENDVVDSQVVSFEFEGGATASFNMIAFTEKICQRQTYIFGTHGQISCTDGEIVEHIDFLTRTTRAEKCVSVESETRLSGHGGADNCLMVAFISALTQGKPELARTSARDALASHSLVFAAEKARKEGKIVTL